MQHPVSILLAVRSNAQQTQISSQMAPSCILRVFCQPQFLLFPGVNKELRAKENPNLCILFTRYQHKVTWAPGLPVLEVRGFSFVVDTEAHSNTIDPQSLQVHSRGRKVFQLKCCIHPTQTHLHRAVPCRIWNSQSPPFNPPGALCL